MGYTFPEKGVSSAAGRSTMRCRRLLPLTVLLLSAPILARAQAPSVSATVSASVGPNDVVARLISFDRNHDGKVESIELPERMRGLMVVGDADGNRALDRSEIVRMADEPHAATAGPGFGFQVGSYFFGDEAGLSSRSHIEGAFEDLRLASGTKDRAWLVVNEFLDARDAAARAGLVKEMERVLTPEQLQDFKAAIDQPGRLESFSILHSRGTCSGPVLCKPTMSPAPVTTLTMISPAASSDPTKGSTALLDLPFGATRAALKRVQALRPLDDVERSQLLERLNGILSDEERDNFRAALERRPLVAPPLFIDVTAR
jgi:hypothetical protein